MLAHRLVSIVGNEITMFKTSTKYWYGFFFMGIVLSQMACLSPKNTNLPVNRMLVQAAVDNGLHYIDSIGIAMHPINALLLDFLQRKYDLANKYSFAHNFGTWQTIRRQQAYASVWPYLRLVDETAPSSFAQDVAYVSPTDRRANKGYEYVMLRAIHCDSLLILPSYWMQLLEQSEAGDYHLTHAALALQILYENNCTLPKLPKNMATLQEQHKKQLNDVIAKNKALANTDLMAEAMAILSYIFPSHRHKNADIRYLLARQRLSGAWHATAVHAHDNPHTSILVLWVLLQYLHPNKDFVPMVYKAI